MENKKKRGRDTNFRNTHSTDGTYSCVIDADINVRLNEICKKENKCKKEFVKNILLDALTEPKQITNNDIVLSEESMQALKVYCKYKKIDMSINQLLDHIIDEYFNMIFS